MAVSFSEDVMDWTDWTSDWASASPRDCAPFMTSVAEFRALSAPWMLWEKASAPSLDSALSPCGLSVVRLLGGDGVKGDLH